MSNDDIELRLEPTRPLSKDEWDYVNAWLHSRGWTLGIRIPLAPKDKGVGPKPDDLRFAKPGEELERLYLETRLTAARLMKEAAEDGDAATTDAWRRIAAQL